MKQMPENEKEFFDKVWVFTAGAVPEAFWLSGHRCIKLDIESGALSGSYPLGYEHHTIAELTGKYTQADVQKLLGNVMQWGVEKLLPKLRRAVSSVCAAEVAARKNIRDDSGDTSGDTSYRFIE